MAACWDGHGKKFLRLLYVFKICIGVMKSYQTYCKHSYTVCFGKKFKTNCGTCNFRYVNFPAIIWAMEHHDSRKREKESWVEKALWWSSPKVVACTEWFHHWKGVLGYGTCCQCDICSTEEVTQCQVCFSLWTELCSAQGRTKTVVTLTVLYSCMRAATLK